MAHKPKPPAPKVQTMAQVQAWIEAYYTPSADDKRTPAQHVLWFAVYRYAEGMGDGMRTKDWASMLLEGFLPYTAEAADEEWAEAVLEAAEFGEPVFDLTEELMGFFLSGADNSSDDEE